jgi:hypothetical protein
VASNLERFCDNLRLADDWLAALLVSYGVRVSTRDVSSVSLIDDSMSREASALNLFRSEYDYISLLDRIGEEARDCDEPVAGVECGCHTSGLYETEEDWLTERLTEE